MAARPWEEEARGAEVPALGLACSLLCPSVGELQAPSHELG